MALSQANLTSESKKHVLKIVATPIGTLQDFSARAQAAIESADIVFCEDTRTTSSLLSMFNIRAKLVSLHLHNERENAASLVDKFFPNDILNSNSDNKADGTSGCTAVLVSDAGTPAISDPGALFVEACFAKNVRVENIPGPSSLACALASNGFLQPRSLFVAFLPRTIKLLQKEFSTWQLIAPVVVVAFESPQRVIDSLQCFSDYYESNPNVRVCLHREISKKFEEHIRGNPQEVLNILKMKKESGLKSLGECVLSFEILEKVDARSLEEILESASQEAFEYLQQFENLEHPKPTLKDACKKLAEKYSISAKELYNFCLKTKGQNL